MGRALYLAFIVILNTQLSFSQGEAYNWLFGNGAYITFNELSNGNPTTVYGSQMFASEGCASISDSDGSLLFYTDGLFAWDSSHTLMPNGYDLGGDLSSTQSSIIIPRPGHSEQYYIFTVDQAWYSNGLRYSRVDMTLNNGLGDVVSSEKSIPLASPTPEKVAAVRKGDGSGFWVISHTAVGDTFLAFSVTSSGVNSTPVISNAGYSLTQSNEEFIGYLKASIHGNKLAVVHKGHPFYEIFDFDNINGAVYNAVQIPFSSHDEDVTYGIEFSPNGQRLYVSSYAEAALYQYDLNQGTSAGISASETLIFNFYGGGGALQIGPDQRIYCNRFSKNFLGVINSPNTLGMQCNYVDTGVVLDTGYCIFGLPTFNSSFLKLKIAVEGNCFGESTSFTTDASGVDSVLWNFGDPNSGPNNESTDFSPIHVFSDTGTYTIRLISYFPLYSDTSYSTIEVYHFPTVKLADDTTLCVGDSLVLNVVNGPVSYLWQDSTDSSGYVIRENGLYHVTLSNQCDTVSDSIRVIFDAPLLVDIGMDTMICEGQTYTFDPGLPDSLSFYWSDSSTASTLSLSEADTVILSVLNGCGSVSDTAVLGLRELAYLGLRDDTLICDGSSILLTHPDSSNVEYLWSDGSSNQDFEVKESGTYTLSAKNDCGIALDSVRVIIVDPIEKNLPVRRILCPGDKIELDAFWNETSSYEWSDGSNGKTLIVDELGLYSVTISDRGCKKKNAVTIYQHPDSCGIKNCVIQAPNVFTPNQDGINDQLRLHRGECSFSRYELNIFNRWGQLVFSSTNPRLGWDGTSNGELLTEGVYFYQLTYTYTDSFDENLEGTLNGTVTLLRE